MFFSDAKLEMISACLMIEAKDDEYLISLGDSFIKVLPTKEYL